MRNIFIQILIIILFISCKKQFQERNDLSDITEQNYIQYDNSETWENYRKMLIEIESFKINIFSNEKLIFKILSDTIIYADGLLIEKIGNINKNSNVEVIDIYYKHLNDKYPSAVRIKTENVSGWISIDNINFLKNEAKLTVNNGIWLYNEVRDVLKENGNRAVKGKIIGNSVPVRRMPSNNSEKLFLLPVDQLDLDKSYYIEEVSVNVDKINGIETAWYKIYKFVEYNDINEIYDTETGYEIKGWVFGSYLSINEKIEFNNY